MRNTDRAWSKWGARDPYYGVLTSEEYRKERLDADSKAKFFQTGQQHFDQVLATIHTHLDSRFSPRRAVDFGCGTGRVLIPMAKTCGEVLGLDISESMLLECQANCQIRDIRNVQLKKSDDQLTALTGKYDFVHSFIVLQHIPRRRGEKLIGKLLEYLGDNGIAVFQVVYRWDAPLYQRISYFVRHYIPLAHRLINYLKGTGRRDPAMQMNNYDINHLLSLIDAAGIYRVYLEIVRHGAHHGAVFYIQKQSPL